MFSAITRRRALGLAAAIAASLPRLAHADPIRIVVFGASGAAGGGKAHVSGRIGGVGPAGAWPIKLEAALRAVGRWPLPIEDHGRTDAAFAAVVQSANALAAPNQGLSKGFRQGPRPEYDSGDGEHLNAAGNDVIVSRMVPVVAGVLTQQGKRPGKP